jgi:hypothetical protein
VAAEATVRPGEFEAHIPAAKNDQMVWDPVQFKRLDIGEGFSFGEAGNGRHARPRA